MATGNSKIFGIGLSKTGTTSVANALQILGYKTKDNMGVVKYGAGDLSSIDLDVVEANDALTDTPIPSFYRELDATFPGSKFILTIRDSAAWLTSCRKQFTQPNAERQNEAHRRLFIDLYGTDVFEEEGFASGYRRFVDGVRDYFKERPQDLLVLDVSGGEGWEKLCAFLHRPVPDIPFPKANVTQIRWMSIDDVVAVAKLAGVELMRRFNGPRGLGVQGDNTEQGRFRNARRVFNAALHALRAEGGVEVAVRKTHNVIAAGLTKLNPRIPVVSRVSAPVEYAERRRWNHCWLVDPLDGEAAFVHGRDDFSVNIALIEDGRPIYGVVHAPATDTTYYGQAGKVGYRRAHDEKPTALAQAQDPWQLAQTSTVRQDEGSSRALAMCRLAEGKPSAETILEPAMEWHTAAAHAILRSVGLHICDGASGRELDYNKQDLANGTIKIATFSSAPAGSRSQIRG